MNIFDLLTKITKQEYRILYLRDGRKISIQQSKPLSQALEERGLTLNSVKAVFSTSDYKLRIQDLRVHDLSIPLYRVNPSSEIQAEMPSKIRILRKALRLYA